jgi:hypothetical protein
MPSSNETANPDWNDCGLFSSPKRIKDCTVHTVFATCKRRGHGKMKFHSKFSEKMSFKTKINLNFQFEKCDRSNKSNSQVENLVRKKVKMPMQIWSDILRSWKL